AKPADSGFAKLHAVRRMRKRMRGCARRNHAAGAGGIALRTIPGGDFVPAVPRPAMHGGMSGRSDPPAKFAGSDYRGLVHRLRAVRAELPIRKYQFASVRGDGGRPGAAGAAESGGEAESHVVRFE